MKKGKRKRKTHKQKDNSETRVGNEHEEKRLELDECEFFDKIEKIKQKLKANKTIRNILIVLFLFLFIISFVLLVLQKSEMKDIDSMQFIEETNSNMGYYLAYISVVYTLFLEFQEWFIDKYREKKTGNKFSKICARLARWLNDTPLFLIPIAISIVLFFVNRFLMYTDYANIICILTAFVQTLFIYNKKRKELEIQKEKYKVLLSNIRQEIRKTTK